MAQALKGIIFALCLVSVSVAAQTTRTNPSWNQLPREQQQILAPIEAEWSTLDAVRKRKWIGIAQRYPQMSVEEQERLQRRMKDWASLTPEQRRAAREKYREFEQLGPDERQAVREKWEQYRQSKADAAALPADAAKPAETPQPSADQPAAEPAPAGAAGVKP